MVKVFQIDFVREAFNWVLNRNSIGHEGTYLTSNDIQLYSFYEHLVSDDEIDRYVEKYNMLVEQQNRYGVIGFGILSTTDTPSIANLKSIFISPFEWACSIRCTLANRDTVLETIYKLIEKLKGKKVDIAQLDNGKLFCVNTMTNELTNGCFVLDIDNIPENVENNLESGDLVFTEESNKLVAYKYVNGAFAQVNNVVPEHNSFEKLKLDFSFDDLKCDEPYDLDATEYVDITFSGSCTLCSQHQMLGNDQVKVLIGKYKTIISDDDEQNIYFTDEDDEIVYSEVEPLEMGSGSNANTIASQFRSNLFKTNSHTDALSLSIEYTFMVDMSNYIISQWFDYARYGIIDVNNGISPNIIYSIKEYWCYWGIIKERQFYAKIVNSIDIDNTEADTLTIKVPMQIQGV